MNVFNIPPEHQSLWEKLQSFQLDNPAAPFSFSRRLAKRQKHKGWTYEYALTVMEEYRKFLFLLGAAGHMVTPSIAVDEAWHQHLLYTHSYWEVLCAKVFKRPMHHFPGDGSNEDQEKFAAVYERTLADYQKFFGTPLESVWGKPNPRIDWRRILANLPPGKSLRSELFHLFPSLPETTNGATDRKWLWEQLRDFPFDNANAPYPFSRRLAKRQGHNQWTYEYTLEVIEEYRKFLFLLGAAEHMVTPPTSIDEAWHLHLIYTHSYWEVLCAKVFKRPMHHFPGDGGEDDQKKFAAVYERTLNYYEHFFGTSAPEHIWGKPNQGIDWRGMLSGLTPGSLRSRIFHLFPAQPQDEAEH
ncbi:MAG: hypothetical protein K2W82_16060 [Candidatus Obscuribacterales bacterium]|nr:hypothetical protein [Candidatus Obscuribacterales bacterium]